MRERERERERECTRMRVCLLMHVSRLGLNVTCGPCVDMFTRVAFTCASTYGSDVTIHGGIHMLICLASQIFGFIECMLHTIAC